MAAALVAVLVAFSCASEAVAQDLGLDDLHLDGLELGWRLELEYLDEQRRSETTNQEERVQSLREELLLRLLGYYYHPKFIEFDLTGTIGLEQRDVDSSSSDSDRDVDTTNISYDFRTRIFKDQPYSIDFYSHRSETQSRQTFFSTNENILQETGVDVRAKNWWIPTRFHFDTYDNEGRGQNDYRESRDTFSVSGTRVEDEARYQYSIEHSDISIGLDPRNFDLFNASASMTHRFGEDRWSNSIHFNRQTGDLSTETLGLSSTYDSRWTDTITASHTFQYSDASIQGTQTTNLTLSSGLTHQLFDSLTSTVAVRLGQATFDGGQTDTHGILSQVDYTKKTPAGLFSLHLAADYYEQDQSNNLGSVAIVDEAQVFNFGTPILLDNPNVITAFVTVTNDSNTILYTEGVDYTLASQGAFTRLDIPPGSLISPGDTILVDYTYEPIPALRFENISHSAAASLRVPDVADFEVSRAVVEQNVLDGLDTGILDDTQRTTVSVRAYPFGMTLGAQYEEYESAISPYQRMTYSASYQVPVADRWSWRVTASSFRTSFSGGTDDSGEEQGVTAGTTLFGTLGRDIQVGLRGEWRDIDFRTDSGSGFLFEADLVKHYRALEFRMSARISEEQFLVAADQDRKQIRFSVTRRF